MSLVAFINEIEAAVGSEDPIRRLETLRAVTTLFVSQAPGLNEIHVGVFDEVILRLSRDVERRARVELAERLADIATRPARSCATSPMTRRSRWPGPCSRARPASTRRISSPSPASMGRSIFSRCRAAPS